MNIRKKILTQSCIFLTYFGLSSLLLFNHKGGADMAFMALLLIGILIHFLFIVGISLENSIYKKGKPLYIELATLFALVTFFLLFNSAYLQFMWWITNLVSRR